MAEKEKFYVVWVGVTPGIYTNWTDCQLQVNGYKGALFKSFATLTEAEEAFRAGPPERKPRKAKTATSAEGAAPRRAGSDTSSEGSTSRRAGAAVDAPLREYPGEVMLNALAVDAACSGNPGQMEYRGVHVASGQQMFHFGPMYGTNNIGEFLAIVHGLALLKQKGLDLPLYSDSRNAMLWIKQKRCKTTLPRDAKTEPLFQLIERAERWLKTNSYTTPILKWQTDQWGEIPADFGRK